MYIILYALQSLTIFLFKSPQWPILDRSSNENDILRLPNSVTGT